MNKIEGLLCSCVSSVSDKQLTILLIPSSTVLLEGRAVAQLVEAVRYKLEDRGFDS